MYQEIIYLLLLLLCPHPLNGYGEPSSSGHPNWQERANHVFLNAVRIAPTQYKTVYMAGYSPSPSAILTSYPAVAPVYLEPGLTASAYYHSNDMAAHACFQHDSCNGTATFTRVKSYYTCSGTLGENIAAGYSDPLDTNNQWLCDSYQSGSTTICAADGSSQAGHRTNMMNSAYQAAGVGYAYNASATYRYYWTQDFGGATCAPKPTTPIYGGSHRISSSQNKFIAVYYNVTAATAPSSATVVISGVSYNLALDIGTAGRATYAYTQPTGTACRTYYFSIGGYRYPETGCLVTYGEGSCTSSFDASCGGTTVATATTASATASTASATSTSGTSSTTGSGATYFLYSTSPQNGWTYYANPGVTVVSDTFGGQTALKAVLANTTLTNFFWFEHNPAVTNSWTQLTFYAAATTSTSIRVFFNGYTTNSKTLTTAWQQFTIPFTALNPPSSLPQLVFRNPGTSTITMYVYNVAFL